MLHRSCAFVIVLALYGCVGTPIPPVPYNPVAGGSTANVNFEIAQNSERANAALQSGGLFSRKGRIYNITLHLYQYEGCRKMERGTVILKPSYPTHSMALRGDELLFVDARFHGSKGWGRSDLVFHLQENVEYTVSTIYEHHTPNQFKMAAYQNLRSDGEAKLISVKPLTYRKGLLSAMLNCRDDEGGGPGFK